MGYRVNVYRALNIAPAVKSNFWIFLPGFEMSPLQVEATSLPFPVYQSVNGCYYKGRKYNFPGIIAMPGKWSVTFAEDVLGSKIWSVFDFMTNYVWNQGSHFQKRDILVAMTLGNTPVPLPHMLWKMTAAWAETINPFDFSSQGAADSLKLTVQFNYDNVENVVLGKTGIIPFNL